MREMTRIPASKMAAMNRRMWNGISPRWQKRQDRFADWRFFRKGGNIIHPVARRLMGPVRSVKLLDLQCGGGEAALSWANLGARVTGVDLSENRLAEARAKAARAGAQVVYVRGNVVRLPFPPAIFERVYTGGGVVPWIPDVRAWAWQIARVLKPGGRFVYSDMHPFLYCVRKRGRGLPRLAPTAGGYFDERPLSYNGMVGGLGRRNRVPQVERTWNLSALVNALLESGLRLVRVEELPWQKDSWPFPLPRSHWRSLPSELVMRWDKPAR